MTSCRQIENTSSRTSPKGRERVNKDTSRFMYSAIQYDFIVPVGKFINAVEISVVDPRSLSVVERI